MASRRTVGLRHCAAHIALPGDTLKSVPLPYQPKARQIVYCDFRGYEVPEMVKRRPVVVLAPSRTNRHLVAVVPLSTTAARHAIPHHVRLKDNLLPMAGDKTVWAKCYMVAVVSIARLDLIPMTEHRRDARRRHLRSRIDAGQFDLIRYQVADALGLLPPGKPGRG
jgi:uncharacterized protein YifN (PemK superfamily)